LGKKNYTFNENIFNLISGKFISQLGDRFYLVALAFWVLNNTKSIVLMGSILLITQLPSAILKFFIKPLRSVNKKRNFLIIIDLLRGIILISISFLYYFNMLNYIIIFLSQLFISSYSAFYNVNSKSLFYDLSEEQNYKAYLEKSTFILNFTTILGPVLGGLFASFIGYGFIFIFNGGSFFLAIIFYTFINLSEVKAKSVPQSITIKTLIKLIQKQKNLHLLIKLLFISSFFNGAMQIIIPFLTLNIIEKDVKNLGFLWGAFGIGITLFSSFFPNYKFRNKDFKLLSTVVILSSISFTFLGFLAMLNIKSIYFYIFICIILGFSINFISIRSLYIFNKLIIVKNTNKSPLLFGNFATPLFSFTFSLMLLNLKFYMLIIILGTISIFVGLFLNLLIYNKLKTHYYIKYK
jgi:MFS family permease